MSILSYHVFNGREWLVDNERDWTIDFKRAASFYTSKRAQDTGERATRDINAFFVMACLGWQ